MLIPIFLLLFFAAAIGWPLLRLYRRTGVFGFVGHRDPDPARRFVARCFGLSLGVLALFGVVIAALGPAALGTWSRPDWLGLLGSILLGTSLLIIVLAQIQMGASWRIGVDTRPTALIEHGLFRWSRNPIYLGMSLGIAGLALVVPSAWTVMAVVLVTVLMGVQARLEEAHLLATHGEPYRRYAARVGRFLPGLGLLHDEH